MKRIIFICRGNLFRSPIAKRLFYSMCNGKFTVESYGTNVLSQGNQNVVISNLVKMKPLVQMLKKRNIDISNEYCKQIFPKNIKNTFKIVVMTEKKDIPIWMKKYNFEYWSVPNPQDVNDATLDSIINILRNKIVNLIKRL